jgi:hypothetical protein
MTTHSTEGKALAITAGVLCALATVGIVLEDVLLHNAAFTLKHGLTVVVIGVTIAMGHLASKARSAGHYLATIGFGVLFIAGTALTVYSSVGRQAEHTMIASAEVEAAEIARVRETKQLASAEIMHAGASKKLHEDCVEGKRGKAHCDGLRTTLAVYAAAITGHKSTLEKLGPARVAVPEAVRAGELLAVFGADPKKVEAGAILVIPFLMTLFLEIGSILCLGYGFRPVRKVSANDNLQSSFATPEPLPPARMIVPDVKGSNIVDWSKSFERVHGRKPRLDETTAAFPEVSRSTCYRRLKAA